MAIPMALSMRMAPCGALSVSAAEAAYTTKSLTSFIYPVIVAWTWGGGWLASIFDVGYMDFAGSGGPQGTIETHHS